MKALARLLSFSACLFWSWAALPADDIHILPPDNIDRLRLDFNASRSKVRLVFMLSPT